MVQQQREGVDATGTVRLPHHERSAAAVRERVGAELGSQGVSPMLLADVALVLSELVSNAVRHAAPLPGDEVEIAWDSRPDGVELRVTDGGADGVPALRPGKVDDVSGRGLAIVQRVSTAWGVESTRRGTTVWALICDPEPATNGNWRAHR